MFLVSGNAPELIPNDINPELESELQKLNSN